ncbi:C45 family autoproteolytic acyltransferase/hydolase [Desulfofustis glycolicus]|uniref:Uncharacterized protein n=1 Tax=Desulfofustis glycolicus DSM 9705 TaxID=1121409 RepID=A0A1M5YKH2_9BACT|nr:C45 family peptidase [Desulfofustis glycolicus]MCB2214780.1 C45 family peptidase [Desulfobulbaceae bacterium]SHI12482.1 protein of unknown function [Desulfofustis glycolicus DSM 9705]
MKRRQQLVSVLLAFLGLVAFAGSAAADAEIYRYIDEAGTSHYSNERPSSKFRLFLTAKADRFIPAASEKPQKTFGAGMRTASSRGTYQVVVLRGSWLEMGRQYGALLADELRAFHDRITTDVAARGTGRAEQVEMGRMLYEGYAEPLRHLLDGMAETSGLSHDQVLVLNAGMILLTQAALGHEPPSACSGIGVWHDYTPSGQLIFGRNWDIDRESMLPYMKYLGIAVFHPEGSIPFANIHPLGNVYLETGINSRGVFIELNNGEYSDPHFYEDRQDSSDLLVRVLTNSATLEQAVAMIEEVPADISYIIQVTDARKAVSIERPTFGSRVLRGSNGLLVTYNSFVPPYPDKWEDRLNLPLPEEQDPRYRNLVSLANSPRFYGAIDAEAMMDLLAVPIEEGGALHAGTVVQVVARPETLTVWLRGVDYSRFEKVELAPLFSYFN